MAEKFIKARKSGLSLIRIILGVSSALLATSVAAQDLKDLSLEDLFDVKVMELASGVEQQVNKAPAVVSVITAAEIKAYGANTVFEALEMVPGLHVVPSSVGNMWPVVTFRGIFANTNPQVLWLIDGKRVSYSIQGGLNQHIYLPIGNIKKIETIRGPASALLGAEAYAGVINLVTYDSTEKNEISVRLGSFDQRRIAINAGVELSPFWRFGIQAEHSKRNSDKSRVITADNQTFFDSLFGSDASLAPGALDDHFEQSSVSLKLEHEQWNLSSHLLELDLPPMVGAGNALTNDSFRKNTILRHVIEYDSADDHSDWRFQPSIQLLRVQSKSKLQLFPDGAVLPIGEDGNINFLSPVSTVEFVDGYQGNPSSRYDVLELDIPVYHLGFKNHQLRYSLGYRYEKSRQGEVKNFGPGVIDGTQTVIDSSFLTNVSGTNLIYLADLSRNVFHFSVQDIWKINDGLEATLGLRFDDYSDVGSTVTPRATLVWDAADSLTAKFVYGQAFRAPSFMERAARNNPAIIGNSNLDNETLDSFEVSLSYIASRNIWLNINVYRYIAESFIQYIPDLGEPTRTAQNINRYDGEGIELEAFWQVSDSLKLDLIYSLQSTENDIDQQQQPFVPRKLMMVKGNWEISDNWQINLAVRGVMDRIREKMDSRPQIEDYWLTNLNLEYTKGNFRLSGSIKNIFDEDMREPASIRTNINDDFPLNERNAFVDVAWKF